MIQWIIASSCLILMMLIIRRMFSGKISARLQYALWLLVVVRLLIPVNLGNSVLSIENFTNQLRMQKYQEENFEQKEFSENTYKSSDRIKVFDSIEEITVSDHTNVHLYENPEIPVEEKELEIDIFTVLFGVWLSGAGVAAMTFFISNLVFGKRLKASRTLIESLEEKVLVYVSSAVETPCLFGVIRPGIYVTNDVAEDKNTLRHAVVHEITHYEQGDMVWAVLRCVCLSLHWYNPLVWWAAKLSKLDAELACDEATIRKLGEDERIAYGKTLIQLTCEKRQDLFVAATTMTSDKKSIKERIQRIAKKSNVSIAALITVVLVSMIVVGCTFTDAENVTEPIESENNLKVTDIAEGDSKEQSEDTLSNAEEIIIRANENAGAEYQDAKLTYVNNAEVGWDYYSDNPWSSETERDALAQAALKELYVLTGYNVTECTYTTDGRSRFIFGKSGDYIRKCIAFYSRDFGFTLCGDSIPYQGYMDARKFHYSDVQQLISPLEDGVEELDGGLSTWYLERSGVYQGEKIIGHEEINQDDTVYVHTKLLFDGGYYVVVIGKRLEIVSEIMGPYYESRHKSELTEQREFTYYNEAQKEKVCLAVMPDGVSKAGGDYKYIVPEDQEKWIKLYNEMYTSSSDHGRWREDERSRGIWIVYQNEWTCMTDQGFIVDFEKRTEVSDAQEFYELCLNEVKKHGINEPIRPEEMKNLAQATLSLEDKMYLLTDEKSLFELQKAFSSSQEIRGGAGCPFTADLCFETKDGEIINISLATDSCNTWLSSGVYYQYPGFEDLEELRSYFNEHGTDISSALDIYSGNILEEMKMH